MQRVGDLAMMRAVLQAWEEDLETGWQLSPDAWGNGYATEAGTALMRWAFEQGVDELFAVTGTATSGPWRWPAGSAWSGWARP